MAGINMGNAAPGLGRLAAAIGGGHGGAYQSAYDNELGLQSKLAQALAAVEASNASARLHNLQADEVQGQVDARKPEALLGSALTTYGIPQQEAPAVSEYLKTGQLGGKYRTPDDGVGPVAPAPDYAGKLPDVQRTLGTIANAITLGDKSVENVAKAEAQRRSTDLKNQVIGGTLSPTLLAQAEYASKGNAPYSFHEFGTGNNLTGTVDDQNGPAQRFGQYRVAETQNQQAGARAHDASAGASRAAAGAHRASEQKTRQDIEMGSKGVLQMTDQGLLLVDPRTAGSRPVLGPNGQPATKAAPPAKALPGSAAKGHLDNLENLRRAQQALGLVSGADVGTASGDPDATGWKGFLPNTLLNKMDPAGVDTRAAISDIGSMVIHDRSGAAVSASEFPRLAPFVPRATDDPETVKKKLRLFVQNYKAIVDDAGEFYRASGYQVPEISRQQRNTPPPAKTTAAPAAPGGFTYLGKE